jgi:hypothetical protein
MSIAKIVNMPTAPQDLAKELGPKGVREILEIFWLAYHDMLKSRIIVTNLDEDEITEYWYSFVQVRWYAVNRATVIKINLFPAPQHPDKTLAKPRGQAPKIDFCFRTWAPDDRYFGAECKNLVEGNTYLINRYIATGIGNYVMGRYGSKSSESAIIGYVLTGNMPVIVNELNSNIDTKSLLQYMLRDLSYNEPHYKSKHMRTLDNAKIEINHLLFNFIT